MLLHIFCTLDLWCYGYNIIYIIHLLQLLKIVCKESERFYHTNLYIYSILSKMSYKPSNIFLFRFHATIYTKKYPHTNKSVYFLYVSSPMFDVDCQYFMPISFSKVPIKNKFFDRTWKYISKTEFLKYIFSFTSKVAIYRFRQPRECAAKTIPLICREAPCL